MVWISNFLHIKQERDDISKKIIIAAACLSLVGCASLKYPNWEQVKIEQSVFKKPCEYKAEERCTSSSLECPEWYKKRATKNNANTVELPSNSATGKYFYCAAGIPPFIVMPNSIWIARTSNFRPTATHIDYDQAIAECTYDSHKATIDTSGPMPERVYIPTLNYDYNAAQSHARAMDEIHKISHELDLRIAENNLFDECLKAKGFITAHLDDEQSLEEHKKHCPDLSSHSMPCFISGSAQ